MLSTMREAQIMKTSRQGESPVYEIAFSESALFTYDLENLCTSDCVFNLDSRRGNFSVGLLLFFGEFHSPGFLHRLDYCHIFRSVALIPSVLLQDAFVRERVLLVCDSLVVGLAADGWRCKQYESCHTGDYGILDRVFLFLSAVMFLLEFRIARPWYLTFCPVMDEFVDDRGATSLVKETSEARQVGCRHHVGVFNCGFKNFGKGVDPLSALLLGHVETRRMILLSGVVLEEGENEKQTVGNRGKRTVGLYAVRTLSREFLALDIMPSEVFVMGISEKWQNLVKKSYGHTRKG